MNSGGDHSSGQQELAAQLDLAIGHHTAGRLAEAETIYQQILRSDPNQPDALNLLGTIALQVGNNEAAVQLITKAVGAKPDYVEAYNNLATALIELGRMQDAVTIYNKAISIKPDYINAYNNLGALLIELGQAEEAVACYREAISIRPDFVEVLNNLGNALVGLGKPDEAVASYQKALAIKPDYAEAHNNMGNAYREMQNSEEAVACYNKALVVNPNYAEALNNLGNALRDMQRQEEALASYRKAIDINPEYAEAYFNLGKAFKDQGDLEEALKNYQAAIAANPGYPEALNNLGNVLLELGRSAEAMASLSKAVTLKPAYAQAHNNLGNAHKELGRLEEAEASYREALTLDHDFAEARCNLGVALKEQGRLDEAVKSFNEALAISPDYAEAHYNLGLTQLVSGDFENGWSNYAFRWKAGPLLKYRRNYDVPSWDGSDIKDKTLFLYPEQGLGDFIQFARYALLLQAGGKRVAIESPDALYDIVSASNIADKVVKAGQSPEHFDYHAPLLDLPMLIGTTLQTIPKSQGYLHPPNELITRWEERLGGKESFSVGLVWAGDPKHKNDRNRSIIPDLLKPLCQIEGVNAFSLQVGRDGEAERVFGSAVTDLSPELTSFGETAAVMMNLDLIVSIDSAPAHLAGALGRPVWTLLPFVPDWRWLLDRDDSPWYPSMRIFRQEKIGDWETVIRQVGRALGELASVS